MHVAGIDLRRGCALEGAGRTWAVPGRWVSTCLVVCEVEVEHPSTVRVAVGGSRTGVDVTLLTRPVVREVQPTNVPEGGGALVEVSGEGFPEFDFVRCKIGSVLGSHARWSSAFSLQCATIAATPGEARLSVAMSGQLQSDGSQYMKYFPMGEVLAIAPQEGLAEQGISVILSGALLPYHPVRVTVGEHTTTAKIGKQGTLTYRTTSTKPGFHQIQMQGTRTEGIQFQYREQPIIKHASTKRTWAGLRTLFHVAGSNLQASCSVGWESASAAAPAHLVSTALAVCEAAWSEEGPATLRVGGSSEGAGVSFAREAHVAGVAPAVSPEAGGAVLSVAGGEFEDSLRCSLGNVAPVGSRWLSAAALECVSVAMRPGAAHGDRHALQRRRAQPPGPHRRHVAQRAPQGVLKLAPRHRQHGAAGPGGVARGRRRRAVGGGGRV